MERSGGYMMMVNKIVRKEQTVTYYPGPSQQQAAICNTEAGFVILN